jgi:hypothetical protein
LQIAHCGFFLREGLETTFNQNRPVFIISAVFGAGNQIFNSMRASASSMNGISASIEAKRYPHNKSTLQN